MRTRLLSCNVLPRPFVIRMRAETGHLHLRMLSLGNTIGSLARSARGACAEQEARALTSWAANCGFLFYLLESFRDAKACSGIAGTRFLCLFLSRL